MATLGQPVSLLGSELASACPSLSLQDFLSSEPCPVPRAPFLDIIKKELVEDAHDVCPALHFIALTCIEDKIVDIRFRGEWVNADHLKD